MRQVMGSQRHQPHANMGQRSKVNIQKTKGNLRILIVDYFMVPNRLCTHKVSLDLGNGQSLWDFNMGWNPPFKQANSENWGSPLQGLVGGV